MKYELAEISDLQTVYDIVQQTIKEIYPKYYLTEVVDFFCEHHSKEAIRKDIENGNVSVLRQDNKIIATGSFADNHITRVYVLPEYQHKGYGTFIVKTIEGQISSNYGKAYLDASLPAATLYEKLGYNVVKHEKYPVENGVVLAYEVMEKELHTLFLDCGFTKENHWYRYRTGAFLVHDNKMLFVKSSIGVHYYLVGGGVHLGETSKKCVEREVLEETGMKAQVGYLSVVCENFFKGHGGIIAGKDCHTIEFYYYMNCSDEEINHCKAQTDDGEELVWIPLDEVENAVIKPTFIKEKLHEIISSAQTIHIIDERDR